ncbi:MAG: hypothetical protein KGK03_06825 [Candidatus Omnitrophica bacterium]|nr:hypothetical protein [Candidatus Omnitrophota bacterium]
MNKKTALMTALAVLGLVVLAPVAGDATQFNFTVSATVPAATGVSVTVSSVNSSTNAFTTMPAGTTALSFDPMTFNPTLGIYLPNHYFALDFGATGGAGTPDLTLTYTEGTNPNGTSNGLGTKTTATFAKEVLGTGGSTTETLLPQGKMRLIDLSSTHIAASEVTGGWPRVYLGVWTGSTTAPADPSNGKPFSNADAAGTYTGSLVITAVVA